MRNLRPCGMSIRNSAAYTAQAWVNDNKKTQTEGRRVKHRTADAEDSRYIVAQISNENQDSIASLNDSHLASSTQQHPTPCISMRYLVSPHYRCPFFISTTPQHTSYSRCFQATTFSRILETLARTKFNQHETLDLHGNTALKQHHVENRTKTQK